MKRDEISNAEEIILPEWPNSVGNSEELDAALKRGLKSGDSDLSIEQIFDEELTRYRNG